MELALRSRLLDERRDVVYGALPGTDEAAATTLGLVCSWLGDHDIEYAAPDPDDPPLVAAGRLVQEDLCLMMHRDGEWHLDAGVLCFPTLWDLHDRLGLPTPRVHERVAHYDEIESRVDRFFDRLPPSGSCGVATSRSSRTPTSTYPSSNRTCRATGIGSRPTGRRTGSAPNVRPCAASTDCPRSCSRSRSRPPLRASCSVGPTSPIDGRPLPELGRASARLQVRRERSVRRLRRLARPDRSRHLMHWRLGSSVARSPTPID